MSKKTQLIEAVLFFDESGICKEMLYPEFEAVLDRVVNLPEFADQQMKAVYILIDTRLHVRAAVFFLIDFLEHGEADSGWNLPLRNLAERGGRGPDLGAGPIRLACRSQCPISWNQMHLWDPDLSPEHDDLLLIRDRIRGNKLRIMVEEDPPVVVPADRLQMASEDKWYSASSAKTAAAPDLEQELLKQRQANEQEQSRLRRENAYLQRRVRQLDAQLEEAKAHLARQTEGVRMAREEMAEQLRIIEHAGEAETAELRLEIEREIQGRYVAELERYRTRLMALEAELACRNQLDAHLQDEVDRLTLERDELARQSGPRVLEKLTRYGVNFVVYQPGAGQFSLPVEDIDRYQRNPVAYAAERCGISEILYRRWLEHFLRPSCQATLLNGDRCATPVERIEQPVHFEPGVSDCCVRHRVEQTVVSR